MSVHSERVKSIARRVNRLQLRRHAAQSPGERALTQIRVWGWMLYHEFLRDDVIIRAQSLAFLMIFSLLPLIAGAFFIFTFLAQFGMVQDALERMVESFLGGVPTAHRGFIDEYIVRFKNAYLDNIARTSRSVGVFALFVLVWIGLQAYNNIDSTLNYIWSADKQRPFFEKFRNFIVVSVVAPVVLTGGFSVPLILQQFRVGRFLLENVPFVGVMLNTIIPLGLLLGIFLLMYRFVPVRRVWWGAAFKGAVFATVMIGMVNALMRVYFAYGTHSAYGKAAAVPLIGFWVYALWIVVILGAEVSFLSQNGTDLFEAHPNQPVPEQGRALLVVLVEVYRAYREGSAPVSVETLRDATRLGSEPLRHVLRFLLGKGLVLECLKHGEVDGEWYALACDPEGISLPAMLEEFFQVSHTGSGPLVSLWNEKLAAWHSAFAGVRIADLAGALSKP